MYTYDIKNTIINAKNPVAFTGYKISELSGFPRLQEELNNYTLKDILTVDFFYTNTIIFYKTFIKLLNSPPVFPNYVHNILSKLNFTIITENFDSLHQKAGSSNVIELNNNLKYLSCTQCNYVIESNLVLSNITTDEELLCSVTCPNCKTILKPKLVLLGDNINKFHIALNEIYKSDLFLIIGSNLDFWPANYLPIKAKYVNCPTIILKDDYSILKDIY
ncbi:SIR2 family NAD-dependent protein deacylase [Clostridium sartagoforme]|uniref:SIR2 family NAD-dependent protein deacylase n=1 Tax=Clostridium sartagoforme TaxID=84031 RepID=UPI0031D9929E